MKGFYSSSVWQAQKVPLEIIPACGSCGLYKDCESPYMKPTGKGKRKVLIVAEAPGKEEDEKGYQLCGNAGKKLIDMLFKLGVNMRRDCWLHNALACRPKDNREPEKKEVDACRPNLTRAIRDFEPNVIIPMGKFALMSLLALAWKPGEVDDTGKWVGWNIPCMKLNSWVCPTYHPSYLLHAKDPVSELWVTEHLKKAFSHKEKPYKSIPNYSKQVRVIFSHREASNEIKKFMELGVPLAFDYETTTLKPDGPNSQIICCSVSDGKDSIAFPWEGDAILAMRELISSPIRKIAANIRFEERWTRRILGIPVRNWYHDTLLGAHWRDPRRGICSLKFQSFVLLGMPDYDSHLAPYMEGKNSNTPNRLREVEPRVLLEYNALDSLLEVLVAKKQLGVSYGK